MKIKILLATLIILWLVASPSFSQKVEWKGTKEMIDEVLHVKNPSEPIYGEMFFNLEEDLTIDDTNSEDYFFSAVSNINVDSKGNIFILDRMQGNIYIFNKLGNFIKPLGEIGQGPGEFQSPRRIGIDSEDRVNVLDNRKLHLFDNRLEYNKTSMKAGYMIDINIFR